ncbi:MAG: hypothetical protein V2J89_02855 [Halieaceae bacterium]|jgi:hypothetical protein|nr:hypothetical protein [Halieaceae bacterium]
MKSVIAAAVTGGLLIASSAVFAAKPTSIVYDSKGTTAEGVEYDNYFAKCSNGKSMPLTAWDNRRKWCVGEASSEDCTSKQIKAAKRACKAA